MLYQLYYAYSPFTIYAHYSNYTHHTHHLSTNYVTLANYLIGLSMEAMFPCFSHLVTPLYLEQVCVCVCVRWSRGIVMCCDVPS